jgi:hypothetical protein
MLFNLMRGTEQTEQYLAQEFAEAIVSHYPDAHPDDFVLADHSHEGLRPGAATVAWEGSGFDWTLAWLEVPAARALAADRNVTMEAPNGHTLTLYVNPCDGCGPEGRSHLEGCTYAYLPTELAQHMAAALR